MWLHDCSRATFASIVKRGRIIKPLWVESHCTQNIMTAEAPWVGEDKTRTYALNGAQNVASLDIAFRLQHLLHSLARSRTVSFPLRSVSSLVSFSQSHVSLYQRISPPIYLPTYLPTYLPIYPPTSNVGKSDIPSEISVQCFSAIGSPIAQTTRA